MAIILLYFSWKFISLPIILMSDSRNCDETLCRLFVYIYMSVTHKNQTSVPGNGNDRTPHRLTVHVHSRSKRSGNIPTNNTYWWRDATVRHIASCALSKQTPSEHMIVSNTKLWQKCKTILLIIFTNIKSDICYKLYNG